MACFRDLSPITNRQKPSHPQPSTITLRALAAINWRHPAYTSATQHLFYHYRLPALIVPIISSFSPLPPRPTACHQWRPGDRYPRDPPPRPRDTGGKNTRARIDCDLGRRAAEDPGLLSPVPDPSCQPPGPASAIAEVRCGLDQGLIAAAAPVPLHDAWRFPGNLERRRYRREAPCQST